MDWLVVLSAAMIGMGVGAALAFLLFYSDMEGEE